MVSLDSEILRVLCLAYGPLNVVQAVLRNPRDPKLDPKILEEKAREHEKAN